MGQIREMEFGFKHFKANEVETLPNGKIHFKDIPIKRVDPSIPDEERLGTTLRPPMHDTTTSQEDTLRECRAAHSLHTTLQASHLAPKTTSQLESDMEIEKDKRENKARPIGPPDTSHSDPKTGQRPPEEHFCDLVAAKEGLPKPSFTPDTYILARKSDKAIWIHLWTATRGGTVVQSLPSGKIEDLSGARVTTIETLCSFGGPEGWIDLVQMGKALYHSASPHPNS